MSMMSMTAAGLIRQSSCFNHSWSSRKIGSQTRGCLQNFCSTSTRQSERETELKAKRARRKSMEEKRAQMDAFLKAQQEKQREEQLTQNNNNNKDQSDQDDRIATVEQRQLYNREHAELLEEASALTRSLYRTCLRCVKVLRPGNDNDEQEFREREAKQIESMEQALRQSNEGEAFFSMSPPVDRENELSSRAAYYYAWTREGFEQESDCLNHNPWRESHVERYLYFLKMGEHRRKWVLKDYKFDDPYPDVFDKERIGKFKSRAFKLLRDS